MSTYTAVIGDVASVGLMTMSGNPDINALASSTQRRNPQVASGRIRTIIDPHTVQDAVGGMISADFTIPAEEAMRWRTLLRYGNVCWLFDGQTPIFVGWLEQPVWTTTGDAQITLSGPWVLLGRSRMREIWEDYDLSQFNPLDTAAGHVPSNSTVTVTAAGRLKIAWPAGSVLAASDRAGVDYFLFGEAFAVTDDKQITAFEFDIIDNNFSGNVNLAFRVIGVASPTSGTGDQLYSTTAAGSSDRQGALNLHGTNQSGAWLSTVGYRCLRFELVATGATTASVERYVVLDRIRVSTRENLFPAVAGNIDTGVVARDVLSFKQGLGGYPYNGVTDLPQEFWFSGGKYVNPDSNTATYLWGNDPRTGTGTAQNTGIATTGFNARTWQSPAEILASLAAVDGAHVGFYLPYNARGGYEPPGYSRVISGAPTPQDIGSFWLSAPPQLFYQPFPDPTLNPDYTIQTREGAQVEQDPNAQPLLDTLFVNYQTVGGRQLSAITADASSQNYAAAQGYRRSEDYTLQGSAGTTLASSLGSQYMVQRRQPSASATITIENDGIMRYPILKQGCVVPHLSQVRPGSVRISDVSAASGLRAGYATHVEWWGQTIDANERIEITLGQPGQIDSKRIQGMIVNRYRRTRRGPFSQM